MPPVAPPAVKERAERLRAEAGRALKAHLDRRLGRTMSALVEAEGRARAGDFTEIAFSPSSPAPDPVSKEGAAGPWIQLRLEAHDGRRARGLVVGATQAASQSLDPAFSPHPAAAT
jgi:threonylcarbamoyladenosine tRNA methylthiotransferase MtaB